MRVHGRQPGQVVETYALFDNGSVSLCDEKLIDELGISEQSPDSFLANHPGEKGQSKVRL